VAGWLVFESLDLLVDLLEGHRAVVRVLDYAAVVGVRFR
jgi:hypothetical protein